MGSDGFPAVWQHSQSLHLGVRKEQVEWYYQRLSQSEPRK